MKKIYALLYLFTVGTMAQSQNYVLTKTYKDSTKVSIQNPTVQNTLQNITYFDGLGRPIQQIAGAQSGNGKSIVTHIEYNVNGVKTKDYLPYPATTEDLAYRPEAKDATLAFYDTPEYENTKNPYNETYYDQSPLNRLEIQGFPGNAWNGYNLATNNLVAYDYHLNSSNEAPIKMYKAIAGSVVNGAYSVSLSQAIYPPNSLNNVTVSDEDGRSQREYKDGEGKIILKRSGSNLIIANSIGFDTYYVYDQFGNLSYVIPPLSNGSGSQEDLDGLCYQYRYDKRNRLVEKKLPGRQWEFIIYDMLDRIAATGPALSPFSNLTSNGGWNITKYDNFGRPIITGWVPSPATSSTRNSLQNVLNNNNLSIAASESKSNANTTVNTVSFRYTNTIWPTAFHVLSVNYYDDYNFPDAPQAIPTSILPDNSQTVYYNNNRKPKGLSTGIWTRILKTTSEVNGELSYFFYDKKGRAVRNYKTNYLGGYTQTDSRIDFSGKVLYTVTEHKRLNGDTPLIISENFTYTDQDRLLAHTHQITSPAQNPVQLLAKNNYDQMGQLIRKGVGNLASASQPLQQIDYRYNIRGWLKEINSTDNLALQGDPRDLFSFKIMYNDPATAQPLYNGNISETLWRTASDNILRKYAYSYDDLNRLTEAIYQKPGTVPVPSSYGESMTYDKNGNIKTLGRYGEFDDGVVALKIDDLNYQYEPNSNRLARVTDATNNPNGFKDDSDGTNDTADDYGYDAFGNMERDDNKGISSISYNHLHLPVKIVMAGGNIEYLYDGAGGKLKKTVTETGRPVKTQEYLSGFVYANGILEMFPTAEGYVKNTAASGGYAFNYVFNYTDHLGNVRLSYGQDPTTLAVKILEENNYYPFGMKHRNYNMSQKNYIKTNGGVSLDPVCVNCAIPFKYNYKYNGKEFQDELGLNLYDYGARNYDPAIGRWMNIDPLAEKMRRHSPYNYAFNNPVYFIDPDGMQATDWYRNMITGMVSWKDGQSERFGYTRLGHTSGHTDINGNRTLLNGDTKQITYNGNIIADFNKTPNAERGGLAIADGGNNQDPSSLDRGGRNAQWVDFKGLIGLIDLLLGREPGKMGKGNPSGKGTNGGGPTLDNKTSDAIDAVGAATGAAKEVDEATKGGNSKEKEVSTASPTEFVRTSHDEKTGNSTWIRKDIYDAQQKKQE